MRNKLTALLLALLVCTASLTPAYAAENKVLGDVLNTDIVTYIDGHPIRSYNINWDTYIVVEDLMQYGFGVTWDGDARRLIISRTRTCTPEYYTAAYVPEANNAANGTVAANYYATDIVTVIGELPVESYNIGGLTCINVNKLAAEFSMRYLWDGNARKVSLTSPNTPGGITYVIPGIPQAPQYPHGTNIIDTSLPENIRRKELAQKATEALFDSVYELTDPQKAYDFLKSNVEFHPEAYNLDPHDYYMRLAEAFAYAFEDYSYSFVSILPFNDFCTVTVSVTTRDLRNAITNASVILNPPTPPVISYGYPSLEERQKSFNSYFDRLIAEIEDNTRGIITINHTFNVKVDIRTESVSTDDFNKFLLLKLILGNLEVLKNGQN